MPYTMITHSRQVLADKAYSSIKGLRMFLAFHRAFMFLLDAHPNVKVDMEGRIKNFIQREEARHKDETPDLGVLLAYVSVSDQYNFEDLKHAFLFESLDRKVFWMGQKVPQLLDIYNKDLDQQRAK